MKNTMKVFLMIALFCSAAFAEGDMGAGGRTCPQGQTCLGAGERTCEEGKTCAADPDDDGDSLLETIQDYLASLIG